MRIPGFKTAALAARRIRSRFVRGGLVLLYHRVAEPSRDPFSLCVSPQSFADQIETLVKFAKPMALADLVDAVREDDVPRRAVAVTFDDGYADNLHAAKPTLERFGVPATVFLATGFLGAAFWWDDLAAVLLEPSRLPQRLRLECGGRSREWHVTSEAPSARSRLIAAIHRELRVADPDERRDAIDRLATATGVDLGRDRASRRALTPAEVGGLAGGNGLIEIGAHTVHHPPLAALPEDAQRAEIEGCRERLRELTGRSPVGFSYPFGTPSDFGRTTMRLVREAGFTHACTNVADVVTPGRDPMRLPRLWVHDWNGSDLRRRLAGWMG